MKPFLVRRAVAEQAFKEPDAGRDDERGDELFCQAGDLAEVDVQGLPATRIRVAGSVRLFRSVREIVHGVFCLDASGGRSERALTLFPPQVSSHVCDELYLRG